MKGYHHCDWVKGCIAIELALEGEMMPVRPGTAPGMAASEMKPKRPIIARRPLLISACAWACKRSDGVGERKCACGRCSRYGRPAAEMGRALLHCIMRPE